MLMMTCTWCTHFLTYQYIRANNFAFLKCDQENYPLFPKRITMIPFERRADGTANILETTEIIDEAT